MYFVGLDIGWRTRKSLAEASGRSLSKKRFINGVKTSYLGDILCENGRFGRKAGEELFQGNCIHVCMFKCSNSDV